MSMRKPDTRTGNNGEKPAHRSTTLGIVEWFRPGEHDRVDQVLQDMNTLGIEHLRTGISWADYYTREGEEWYNWLFPKLGKQVNLLPCFLYTPPSHGIEPKTSSPPRNPKDYADFLDTMITRFGEYFDWVELWNEPNNVREWDWTLDKDWLLFSEMIGGAAYWARQRGKKTVLGGMSPIDPNWLEMMYWRGVMQYIDAIGIHGFPNTFQFRWSGWEHNIERIKEVCQKHGEPCEVWITEAGYSTWRYGEHQQVHDFVQALDVPAQRLYWYGMQDLDPELPTVDGCYSDEREYHFGLKRSDGSPKLLYRLLEHGGVAETREFMSETPCQEPRIRKSPYTLIVGGAGFIGTNTAARMLDSGRPVLIYDNLSRPGVERNLRWLKETYGDLVQVEVADVRDSSTLCRSVQGADRVFQFSAQVAVTTSLVNPINDFEINARGTLNLLEAIRRLENPPPLLFTSTNKVYGALDYIKFKRNGTRYEPDSPLVKANGVSEDVGLDFHSPYGCSKGSAEQYVLDYSRSYGLDTVVFRMSCIYGPHQFGTEDQGWVAHFLIRAIEDKAITIYGDGMQVRDILFVEDLVDAFMLAHKHIKELSGQAFNIGGGPKNTISLIELLRLITDINGKKPIVKLDDWRVGDQRYYVSDTTRFHEATGWRPGVTVEEGVKSLNDWLLESRGLSRDKLDRKERSVRTL